MLSNITIERRKSGGNYDGFFGKITNFDWKFNTDGTYDITVFAISIGDVIESLTINRTLPTFNPPKEKKNKPVKTGEDPAGAYYYINVDKTSPNHKGNDYRIKVKTGTENRYYEYWICQGNAGYDKIHNNTEGNEDAGIAEFHRMVNSGYETIKKFFIGS